uniref:Reverse transcriptase domain-containing protein n=1 Tax=Chromera velia CCMP2878 TaxID=1169474 RepID=A0A0G4HAE2_9ALVE|eukprot:Cvel_893.t1-p1 / transcript=Cvel_893.t1 / gene=Cvel_893 / organism=Chromera_velia_CCMP2878 / gene_product=Retrovirus-related Pol polyprotein from transposon, putative / transcript_product=Retrovirus-related Pol polyprotein from transposon, putative / location=Cvel_scaffold28:70360-72087(-) / protein_length=576 / sequence_SO=supercontig / SO=protein_coding / is_pseudo=false
MQIAQWFRLPWRCRRLGGSGLKVLEETTISLSHPNNPEKKFPHTLLVTADTGYDLVLGQDFLKLKDPVVQYHYRKDRLVVADLPVFHCWYDDRRKPMRVAPLRQIKVTKRSRALLRVDIDGGGEEETVILHQNFPRAHPGLAVPDQIVTVRAGVATIEVLNVSQQDFWLGTESLLTFAKPASRVASVTAVTAVTANVTTSTPPQNLPLPPSLPKVDLSHIPPEVRGKYESLLREHSDLWSRSRFDIGEVRIPTGDAPPIRWNQDRVPYHQRDHVKKEIEAMEEGGVIRKSSSPWAAPVILVKKPDGTTHFCLDFRKLNQATKRDLFPLPRIQETLDRLTGAQVFSVLDYTSGFFQLKMHEADAEKTAFVTLFGLYEFTRMPFGLVNAPSIFQRVMMLLLTGLTRDIALVYIDDIIVFSCSHIEHLRDLREVLGLVRQANLKLKLEKAQIALREVEYLGHSVSFKGIRPSRKNVKKVLEWESSKDRKELRSFLYLCSYYRHFVAGFARLMHPLHELLKPADKEGRPLPFQWGEEAEAIFTELKRRLTTPLILAFPDMSRPFTVKPDACKVSVEGLLT